MNTIQYRHNKNVHICVSIPYLCRIWEQLLFLSVSTSLLFFNFQSSTSRLHGMQANQPNDGNHSLTYYLAFYSFLKIQKVKP